MDNLPALDGGPHQSLARLRILREAAIVPRNTASRRVAEKLGLREEGTSERFLQIRGVYEDHVRYAITVEEWHARRDEIEAVLTQSV